MKLNLKNFLAELKDDDDVAYGEADGFTLFICQSGGRAEKRIIDAVDGKFPSVIKPKSKKTVDVDSDEGGEGE